MEHPDHRRQLVPQTRRQFRPLQQEQGVFQRLKHAEAFRQLEDDPERNRVVVARVRRHCTSLPASCDIAGGPSAELLPPRTDRGEMEVLKRIQAEARRQGIAWALEREGANHSVFRLGDTMIPIP